MAENNTKKERSSKDIRHDIAKGEENISQTVGQIGERIKEKLDWHGYVKDSPYLAIGAAAGLGYLASEMFITRTTPLDRIMGSIAEEIHGSTNGTGGPSIIRMTLQGIALKAAANWIKKSIPTDVSSGKGGRGSTISPKADTSETTKQPPSERRWV